MAIGDITASGGLASQIARDNSGTMKAEALANFGASVSDLARAGVGLLNSATDIDQIYHNRSIRSAGLEQDTKFLALQEARAADFTEFTRSREGSPIGMAKEYDATLAAQEKDFLAGVPPLMRETYKAKLDRDRIERSGSMLRTELGMMDDADAKNLGRGLDILSGNIRGKTIALEDAQLEWEDMVTSSGLPEAMKAELKLSGRSALQGSEFTEIIEDASRGYGVVTDNWSGNDVVAAGIDPAGRGVLNVISAGESDAYDKWNGGNRFSGYSDHPAALGKAPGKSTAAGRYQFILGTWRAASASYEKTYGVKVPDFSPGWQDRVALHWAEVQFNRRNKEGLNFRQVLASGDPAQLVKIRTALGNPTDPNNKNSVEWEGLGDGYMTDEKFLSVLTGQQGLAGGGSGSPSVPDVWNDPRYSDVSYEQKNKFSQAAWDTVDSERTKNASAIKKQVSDFNDRMYGLAYNGASLSDMEQYRTDSLWSIDAEKQFRQGVKDYREKESSIRDVQGMLANNQPLGPQQSGAFAQMFGAEGFRGIQDGDAASYDRLRGLVGSARMFPEGSVESFRIAARNPSSQAMAMEFLAEVYKGDPSVLARSGFTDKDIADATFFSDLASMSTPEEAKKNFALAEENARILGKDPGKAREAAMTKFTELYTPEAIDKLVRPWEAINSMNKTSDGVKRQLYTDGAKAFGVGWAVYGGDQAAATKYMEAYLNRTWGMSYSKNPNLIDLGPISPAITGNLMKYPPENYYNPVNGDYHYLYASMELFANESLPEGAIVRPGSAILVSDAQTETEVQSIGTPEATPPTYTMVVQGEFGEIIAIPGRFGGQGLHDLSAGLISDDMERQAAVGEMSYATSVYDQSISDLVELESRAVTPEQQAEVEARKEAVARAKTTYENAEQALPPRGPIAAEFYNIYDTYRKAAKSGLGINPPDMSTAGKQATAAKDVMADPVFRKRLNSSMASIVKERRDESGRRYNNPAAERIALKEIFMQDLMVTDADAEKLVDKYYKGGL